MIAIPRPKPSAPPSAGDVVSGRYRLDRPLGEGGMGEVWLAHNDALDKDIALKFLRSDTVAPDASLRFAREAHVTARVEHPAVVRVFDFGETEGGQPYMVMERLEGETLADRLDTGPLGAIEAVRILLPIVDGLTKVHDLGIVHRDIKPENVFLAREGGRIQPKLLDFGIARLEAHEAATDPRLTCQGSVLGSPSYMSPEQARGLEDIDGRADVWAVCMVIYEAIRGTCPFQGQNFNAILRSIIDEPIPPLPENHESSGIWAILRRGLAKNRYDRIPTMRDLGRALASWLVTHGVDTDIHGNGLRETWGVEEEGRHSLVALVETLPSLEAPISPARASRARTRAFWVPVGLAAVAVGAALLLSFAVGSSALAGSAQANDEARATAPPHPPPRVTAVASATAKSAEREDAAHAVSSPRSESSAVARPRVDAPRAAPGPRAGARRAPAAGRDRRATPAELGLKEAY